jgi:hypothetical protein
VPRVSDEWSVWRTRTSTIVPETPEPAKSQRTGAVLTLCFTRTNTAAPGMRALSTPPLSAAKTPPWSTR